ncbi:hypothetical protein Tco_1018686 [Tanacetum coccineum]|uniref:Tf2-1-like SH3-like domain-containing protein n=1 Tax=Tanacetum coccineum TaxID=301880 RepID=A0ABQ5FUZ9_9ASTR
MQAARDRQKSYADLKRKPMEFQVGDKVMLKVSPWKGVVRFGKWGKLNPRYVGPFKEIKKVGDVAYKLELPEELSRVHNTFHVSNLKKCHADEPLAILLDGLHFDDKLHFVEEPVEIVDHEVKRLKRIRIPLVKVRWNSKRVTCLGYPYSAATHFGGVTDTLLQSLFDEYLHPPPCVDHPVLEVATLEPDVSTGIPSSTTVDQDAPSPNTSQTLQESSSHVISPGAEEADHDTEVAHMDNEPYLHHPIDNVIGDPSRSVSTRHQLQTEALFCYFDAFLSSVEPKSYKESLTESCWIEAMQEELNEFERLEDWELVPRPDRVMIITLKLIYKVKLDELGGVLKNKARLVARGYRQEEVIDCNIPLR